MWEDIAVSAIPRGIADVSNFMSSLFFGNRNNQWNQEAATTAYNRQIDLMNMTRAYDTPAAQMQRFKDAGLNPNLIYGQMQGGIQPPTAPQSSPSQMVAPQTDPIQLAQTRLINAEAEGKEIENAKKPDIIDSELKKLQSEVGLNNQQVENLRAQFDETKQATENLKAQMELIQMQAINMGYQNRLAHEKTIGQMLDNIYASRTTDYRVRHLAAECGIKEAEARLAYRSGLAAISLLTAQAFNQRKQGALAKEQADTESHRREEIDANAKLLGAKERTEGEQYWLTTSMTQFYYSATGEKDASTQFINVQREYEQKWGGWERGFGLFRSAMAGFRDGALGVSALAAPGAGAIAGSMTSVYDGVTGQVQRTTVTQPFNQGQRPLFPRNIYRPR